MQVTPKYVRLGVSGQRPSERSLSLTLPAVTCWFAGPYTCRVTLDGEDDVQLNATLNVTGKDRPPPLSLRYLQLAHSKNKSLYRWLSILVTDGLQSGWSSW